MFIIEVEFNSLSPSLYDNFELVFYIALIIKELCT